MAVGSLESAFVRGYRGSGTSPAEDRLQSFVARARCERPALSCDDADLVAYAAARIPGDGSPDEVLDELRAGDLLLASACAAGDRVAVAAFEAELIPVVRATIGRMRATAADLDEVTQLVRQKLLVGEDASPPRIEAYAGRGDLARWVKAIAARAWIDRKRGKQWEVPVGDEVVFDEVAKPELDPELQYLKHRYGEELRAAFFEALGQLTDLQKNVLRHRYVDGLIVEDIAAIYQAHRATAHRWLAEARDELATATQRILEQRLALATGEYESLCKLVQSQLDWSIARALS